MGLQELAFEHEFDGVDDGRCDGERPPEDWPLVLSNLRRAVRPGGHMYLTVEEIDDRHRRRLRRQAETSGLPAVAARSMEGDTAGYHFYPGRARCGLAGRRRRHGRGRGHRRPRRLGLLAPAPAGAVATSGVAYPQRTCVAVRTARTDEPAIGESRVPSGVRMAHDALPHDHDQRRPFDPERHPGPADAASEAAPLVAEDALTEVKPRRRIWLRLLVGFVLGVLLCLGVAGGSLLALDGQYEGRVLSGVHVAGIDLSGLDRAQASAALTSALAGYGEGQVVVQTSRGNVTVPYAAFSRRADVDAMVDQAMQTGRAGTPLERAFGQVRLAIDGVTIPAGVALDPEALTSAVSDGVAKLRLEPLDGRVVKSAGSIYTMPAKDGVAFDGAAAAAAALQVVSRTDAPAEVVVGAPATAIAPAHDDSEAIVAKTSADRMISDDVIVQLGKKHWTMRAKVVATWVRFDTVGGTPTPTVNEAAIAKALKRVAKSVKTAPASAIYLKDRRGRVVGVVPAKDGRQLDVPATSAAIVAALRDRAAGSEPAGVAVKTLKVAPKLTTEEAAKRGPVMSVLGTWKTWFPISDHNFFGANIWQPGQDHQRHRALPGPAVRVVVERSARSRRPAGSGRAGSSRGPHRADRRARRRHVLELDHAVQRRAARRAPDGRPRRITSTTSTATRSASTPRCRRRAAVARRRCRSPTTCRTRSSSARIRYIGGRPRLGPLRDLGIPDGRTVSLSKPSVSNVLTGRDPDPYVSTLKHGVREQTEFPANGMDVAVTRVVRKNGKVIHSETYRTHYVLWNGIIQVGR